MKLATEFHGDDGFGDHPDIIKMEGYSDCIVKDVHAAQYLVQRSKESNFNIICLGPLTNIALACWLDTKFPTKIDNLYLMGGTIYGKGNQEWNVEYNFYADPEAAHKVFKHFKNIHIIPWEACPEFNAEYKEIKDNNQDQEYASDIPVSLITECMKTENPYRNFIAKAHKTTSTRHYGDIHFCDGLVPLVIIDPTISEQIHELEAEVYIHGEAAGQISYAWPQYKNFHDPAKVNSKIYHKFNVQKTIKLFLNVLK